MIHKLRLRPETAGIGMTSQRTRDRLVRRLQTQGISDQRVLAAISAIPRHAFIDEALASRAYEDTALPIGQGQTISQPYVVALMTAELLAGRPVKKVLEIGTGSGYQAAVLAALVDQVFTLERIEELLKRARRRFHQLKLNNIFTRYADGQIGWTTQAPFDGIIVTAAANEIPTSLVDQLAPGAALVAPVNQGAEQRLIKLQRSADGEDVVQTDLGGVVFVPLLNGLK